MFKPVRTTHPMSKLLNNSLIDLPAPVNISIWWNYGSLLGLCLVLQTTTGLFLSMHYVPNTDQAFISVVHIMRDVNFGWLLRSAHTNGASMFFLFLYIHMGRGIYYSSYTLFETWNIGVILFILAVATAFMGYVLPWGQMSFWGATVITNIFSAIPYLGHFLVEWIWGGFTVNNATLNRFFALHFILPFLMMGLTMLHFMFLHQTGSNNPLGINSDSDRIPFHFYHTSKDLLGYLIAILALLFILLFTPNFLTDPENFLNANPLTTPTHIQPEWYFLWLYAILRSIPNKLGGVLAIFVAFAVIFTVPNKHKFMNVPISFFPLNQAMYWLFITSWFILEWIGARPVEEPFITIGQISTAIYFIFFISDPLLKFIWNKYTFLHKI